jgi:2-keto-4-pentenoate hydratase
MWEGARGPADLAEVYRIQDDVRASLDAGARATAWKVSPPRDDAEPTASPVPNAGCHASPARLAAAGFHMLGIEVEIAFRFRGDLPPRTAPFAEDEVHDAVEGALVTLELCDTRLAGWKEAPPLWRLADFQSNGALIVGNGVEAWRDLDYRGLIAELWINGAMVSRQRGTHPSGDPSRLLPWLAAHCARRCGGLRAGDLVTTGSWTGMHAAAPGDAIVARFPAIGEARLTLTG